MDSGGTSFNYYLVDYDSVGQSGLNIIMEYLSGKDKVTIFYTTGKSTIDFSLFKKIHSSLSEINFQEMDSTMSLKIFLASYLAYDIMRTNSNVEYYIVSNNKEFETLKKFWEVMEIDIKILSNQDNTNTEKPNPENSNSEKPKSQPKKETKKTKKSSIFPHLGKK